MRLDDPLIIYSPHWRTRAGEPGMLVGSGKAMGHAWIEWRVIDDGRSVVVAVNGQVAMLFKAPGDRIYVAEDRSAETGESIAACGRAAAIVASYHDLLKAHNAVGDLLQSGRRFIVSSKESERAGLQDASIDWTTNLVAAMRAMIDEFAGPDVALTVEQHAIVDRLRGFLPDKRALEAIR